MARRLGYLAVFFLAISTTTFAQVVQGVATSGPAPVIDVKAYGAKGDGTTDDHDAIQAAITACPTSGCTIFFPAGGTYLLNSGLTIPTSGHAMPFGVKLVGECGANLPLAGNVSCSHLVSSSLGGTTTPFLTIGNGTKYYSGLVIQDLGFEDTSSSLNSPGALQLVNTEDFTLIDIHCEHFTQGYCMQFEGGGDFTQFGTIINPTTNDVKFPIQTSNKTSEINIYGGNLLCNLSSVGTASIGLDLGASHHVAMTDEGGEWSMWGGHVGNCRVCDNWPDPVHDRYWTGNVQRYHAHSDDQCRGQDLNTRDRQRRGRFPRQYES